MSRQLFGAIITTVLLIGCTGGSDRSSVPPPVADAPDPVSDPSNRAPVTVNDFLSLNGTTVSISVLANDSDPDGDSLEILFVGRPSHGVVEIDDNGTPSFSSDDRLIYTANGGYTGTDVFSYTVSDGRDGRANGYVSLIVGVSGAPDAAANQKPIAKSDAAATEAPQAVTIDVLENDSDGDNQTLSLFSFSAAANGAVGLDDNGTPDVADDDRLVYSPDPGFSGSDSLIYSVTDGIDVSTGTINIFVTQPNQTLAAAGEVCGIVTLGPVVGASIAVFDIDDRGDATGAALAQSQTDSLGRWCVTLPQNRGPLLVESRGGFFQDPSDSRYETGSARLIAIADQYAMQTILPADADFSALTVFSNAVLRKTRNEVVGGNFITVFEGNRDQAATAFGLDVFSTDVSDPVLPASDASEISRQYAMAVGAAATSLNQIAVDLDVAAPNYILIDALIRDLSECRLDGRDLNGPVNVLINGQVHQISDDIDMNLQILRFRNNLTSAYAGVPLLQIDQLSCAQVVVRADTTAPRFSSLPNNMRLIPVTGNTVALSDQIIQRFINAAIASDDRDGIVPVIVRLADGSDLPSTLTVGSTAVEFNATDSAGNAATPIIRIIEVGQSGPPQVFPESVTTAEDTAIAIDVLANDLGQENPLDASTVQVTSGPQFGSLSVDATTGVVSYVPFSNQSGIDEFGYSVADQGGKRSEAVSVSVDVVAQNDSPVALPDLASTLSSQLLVIDVLGNDYDVEGGLDYGSLQISTAPGNGMAVVDFVSGTIVYSPAPDFTGTDTFRYRVADSEGAQSGDTLVSIDVLAIAAVPNIAPFAVNDLIDTAEETSVDISVLVNDGDMDGVLDPLSVTVLDQPAQGVASIDSVTGDITYTPAVNYFGVDSLTYRVADELGLWSGVATVYINISPVNDNPVAQNDVVQGTEDTIAQVALLANDSDADGLAGASVILINQPSHGTAVWDAIATVLVYTPEAGFDGSDSLSYQIQDSDGLLSAPAQVVINLTGQNDSPVATADSFVLLNNVSSGLDVLNNDVDIDSPLLNSAISIQSAPTSVSVAYDPVTDQLIYSADVSFEGADSFTYQVTDPDGAVSNTVTVSLDVQQTQFAPMANNDAASAQEQLPVSISVLVNDTDVNNDVDLSSVVIVTLPANGVASVDPGGQITYTSSDNFAGVDTLEYTIADALGARSGPALVTITVSDVAEPPIASDDNASTPEDAPALINVLMNDSDPESNIVPGSVVVVTAAQNGSTTSDPVTGIVTYTPDTNYFGPDSFAYTVSDATGLVSNVATVNVSVTDVNDVPMASDDVAVTDEDTSVNIVLLINDSDIDGSLDASQVVLQTLPAQGIATIDPVTGSALYTPNADYFGVDSFTYQVSDDDGAASSVATVSITVNPVNDVPVANNDAVATDENVAIQIDVAGNDTDADGFSDLASIQLVSMPASGTVTPGALPTEFLYTPDFNSNGSDQFSYQILDTSGAVSNTASVDITVAPLPSPPVTVDRNARVDNDTYRNIRVLRNATDPEDDIVPSSVMVVADVTNGTTEVRNSGRVRYTPNPGYVGIDVFTFNVSDATGLVSNVSTVTVTVSAANATAPVASDVNSVLVFRGDTPIIDLNAAVVDSDGTVDFSTLSVSNESTGSANVLGATGTVQFDLPVDFVGVATFEYSVEDNDGLDSNTAEVFVTVWPAEDRDLDGVAEALEIKVGTDPLVADSVYVHIDPDTPATTPDGSSWNQAFPNLEAALDSGLVASVPGNIVYILLATNTGDTTVGKNWSLSKSANCDNLVFVGSLDPFVVTPRKYSSGSPRTKFKAALPGTRPVELNNCSNVQFHYIRFSGGNGVTRGGGIKLARSEVLLNSVHVRYNEAIEAGGGIYVDDNGGAPSSLTVESSSIRDNSLLPVTDSDSSGGGIYMVDGAGLNIVDSIIRHNDAPINGSAGLTTGSGGGGVFVSNTPVYISNTAISVNRAGQCGGGLNIEGVQSMRLEHNFISGNEARNLGGGMCIRDTDANFTMHNNLLASNYAPTGGGIYAIDMDKSRMTSNTVVFNLADLSGGGLHLDPGPDPVLNYNVVQFNRADGPTDDVGGDSSQLFALDANYNFVTSFFASFVGTGNSSVPVQFDNGYYLEQSSPAVNYGVASSNDPLYSLNLRYTDKSGTITDLGLLDAGFHYAEPQIGNTNGLQVFAPDGLTEGGTNQRIRIAPLVDGEILGPGHRLYVRAQQSDVATHLYEYTSDVLDPLSSGGSTQLSDLGTGYYEVLLDIPAGRDEIDLVLYIDSLSSSSYTIQIEL